jgi:hypothetical protein
MNFILKCIFQQLAQRMCEVLNTFIYPIITTYLVHLEFDAYNFEHRVRITR